VSHWFGQVTLDVVSAARGLARVEIRAEEIFSKCSNEVLRLREGYCSDPSTMKTSA